MKTHNSKTKVISLLMLTVLVGILIFPVGVFAASGEDVTPPTLTATLSGNTLHIEASDEGSGVSAVYVDSHRINALAGGKADVNLKDYAGNAKQTEVYAVDGAGNKSKIVTLANPYYKAPVPLAAPQASQGTASNNAAAPPAQSTAPAPAANTGTGGSGNNEGANTTTDSAVSESAVPSAFTPDGSGTTLDNATDADGKEFFTVEAADGSVFYLVIDRQRGAENVYFLNAVTTNDLLSLAEDAGSETSGFIKPEPEEEPAPTEAKEEESAKDKEPDEKKNGAGSYIFIVLAILAVAGGGYYFKIYRPKKEASLIDADDYEYEDEAEYDADFSYEDELYPAAYENEYLADDIDEEMENTETKQSDEEKEDTY